VDASVGFVAFNPVPEAIGEEDYTIEKAGLHNTD